MGFRDANERNNYEWDTIYFRDPRFRSRVKDAGGVDEGGNDEGGVDEGGNDDGDNAGYGESYEYPVYNWAPSQFQRGQYQSEYADLIKAAADRVSNWNYDPSNDASYRSYARQYTKAGSNAYEDTLARLASRTGGVASSYAVSAAQQQYNKYMSDLAAKVPELERLAYDRAQNTLNMYTDLDKTAYGRWNDDEERRYKAWAANQSAAQSAYNQRYNAELNKYKASLEGDGTDSTTNRWYQIALENAKSYTNPNHAVKYIEDMVDAERLSAKEAADILEGELMMNLGDFYNADGTKKNTASTVPSDRDAVINQIEYAKSYGAKPAELIGIINYAKAMGSINDAEAAILFRKYS